MCCVFVDVQNVLLLSYGTHQEWQKELLFTSSLAFYFKPVICSTFKLQACNTGRKHSQELQACNTGRQHRQANTARQHSQVLQACNTGRQDRQKSQALKLPPKADASQRILLVGLSCDTSADGVVTWAAAQKQNPFLFHYFASLANKWKLFGFSTSVGFWKQDIHF